MDINAIIDEIVSTDNLREFVDTRAIIRPTLFLDRLLPPQTGTTDEITSGTVRIVASPAQLTALDSPFAKGGSIRVEDTSGVTFKITKEAKLTEGDRKRLQARAARLGEREVVGQAVRSLLDDGLMAALDLGEEYFRAQRLAYDGVEIKQGDNKIVLPGVLPADHKLDRSSAAKGDWAGAQSTFWADVVDAGNKLRTPGAVKLIMGQAKFNAVRANEANAIRVEGQPDIRNANLTVYTLTKKSETINGNDLNGDERVQVYVYTASVENEDGTPGESIWPAKRASFFRTTARNVELVDGSVVQGNLGVTWQGPNTHLPGNTPGRYLRAYIPQENTAEVRGQAAEFIAPHLQEPRSIIQVSLS